jgi:hypothetical protein
MACKKGFTPAKCARLAVDIHSTSIIYCVSYQLLAGGEIYSPCAVVSEVNCLLPSGIDRLLK